MFLSLFIEWKNPKSIARKLSLCTFYNLYFTYIHKQVYLKKRSCFVHKKLYTNTDKLKKKMEVLNSVRISIYFKLFDYFQPNNKTVQ